MEVEIGIYGTMDFGSSGLFSAALHSGLPMMTFVEELYFTLLTKNSK